MPGIGPIIAAILVAEIGDVHRFRLPVGGCRTTSRCASKEGSLRRVLLLGFDDEVERGLGCTSEVGEACFGEHLAKLCFAGLCPERAADLLGQRVRCADGGGSGVEHPPNRVAVVLEAVSCEWLNEQNGAVIGESFVRVACCADGVAHVVKAVEEADEVEALVRVLLGRRPG